MFLLSFCGTLKGREEHTLQYISMPKNINIKTKTPLQLTYSSESDPVQATMTPNGLNVLREQSSYLRELSNTDNNKNVLKDSEEESSVLETSSNDQFIKQHIICINYVLQKVKKNYFKSFSIFSSGKFPPTHAELELDLEQYLELQNQGLPFPSIYEFDNIMHHSPHLRSMLNWIYDFAPQFIVPDLIFSFRNIVLWFHRNKRLLINQKSLGKVNLSPEFLRIIFSDPHLNILRFESYSKEFQSRGQLSIQTIPYLMNFLTITIFMIIRKDPHNPVYQTIKRKGLEGEEVELQKWVGKKGKKIKKQSEH